MGACRGDRRCPWWQADAFQVRRRAVVVADHVKRFLIGRHTNSSLLTTTRFAADPLYLVSFLVYFVMGYLFYATLHAGIGAVCNSIKETQHLMMPVIVPMLIPLLAMFSIVQDPNGILARILSFIPPFTPFIMMNRAAGPPEVWEYAATSLLMVATIILTLRGTAKVFRIGILMTGKPPKLMEMVKWFALREGTAPPQREEA